MSKLFTHAGYSKLNGVYKARFANDAMRVKVLEKGNHEDVQIEGLLTPMTKEDAVAYLIKINFAGDNALAQAALEAELDKRTDKPKAEKAPRAPKAPKAAKAEPITVEGILAKVKSPVPAEVLDEEAPF
jgi:hypothetical protein